MSDLIIDMHCHLGDILYPGGGARIFADRPMARPFDPDALRRLALYRFHLLDNSFYRHPAVDRLMVEAERQRNFTATLKNLSACLDRFGIDRAVPMPVAPNTTFEDLLPAVAADARLCPFGSVDFSTPDHAGQALRQLSQGARGFKLHPILQRVAPEGPEVLGLLSALPAGTVLLLHAGEARYYPRHEESLQRPEYGDIAALARLCRDFPALRFVAAHGGLGQFAQVVTLLSPLPNAWVDTSFVSPPGIRVLLETFGAGRVLFASDWPYGFHGTALACTRAACRGNQMELERVLGANAAELLAI